MQTLVFALSHIFCFCNRTPPCSFAHTAEAYQYNLCTLHFRFSLKIAKETIKQKTLFPLRATRDTWHLDLIDRPPGPGR